MRALLAALLLVVLAGCGSTTATGDKGYVSGDGDVRTFPAGSRPRAPAIAGTTLQGQAVTVKALAAGRPTVLNVWGAWCADCREEAPTLDAAAKRLGDTASFVGVNVRDASPQNPLAYERRYDVTYPSLFDPDGRALLGMPRTVPVYAIPTTLVLDGTGHVAAVVSGAMPSARTLEQLVQGAAS